MGFTLEGSVTFSADHPAPERDSVSESYSESERYSAADHLLLHGHDISEGDFTDENVPNTSEAPHGRSRRAVLVSTGKDPFVLVSSSMELVKDHLKEQLSNHRSGGKDDIIMTGGSVIKSKTIKKKAKAISPSKSSNILQRKAVINRNRKRGLGPSFVDYFGWCTWDSFYTDLSSNRILSGLESFKSAGVRPRFLILDDGWQVQRYRHYVMLLSLSVCLSVCLSV